MPGYDLLKYLSDPQDRADVYTASKDDPSLLELPEMTGKEKWRDTFTDISRFFGQVFKQPDVIQRADQMEAQHRQQRELAAVQKFLPVLGKATAERQETARQDKLAQQTAAAQQKNMALFDRMKDDFVIDDGKGNLRSPSLEEVAPAMGAMETFLQNPQAGFPHDGHFAQGLRPATALDRDNMRRKLQDAEDAAKDGRAEAAAVRSDARHEQTQIKLQDRAEAKVAEAHRKSTLDAYAARERSEVASAERNFKPESNPADKKRARDAARTRVAIDESADVVRDPERLRDTAYIRRLADALPPDHKLLLADVVTEQWNTDGQKELTQAQKDLLRALRGTQAPKATQPSAPAAPSLAPPPAGFAGPRTIADTPGNDELLKSMFRF